MPDQLSLRGGTTTEHTSFTGANKEVTVDTTKKTLVVHDGATAGGHPIMRENGGNSALSLGSAGTPALKFSGDTNTGIYSPGADQVSIATGGTERLRIDSNGQLEAVSLGSAASPTFTYVGDPNTGTFSPAADAWGVSTNGTERLRITSTGLVGIGTTSPTEALTVAGNASFTMSGTERFSIKSSTSPLVEYKVATNNYFLALESVGTSQGAILFNTGTTAASERARIDSSGRLLVGTSTALTNIYTGATATTPQIQLSGSGLNESSLSLLRTGPTGATIFLNAGSSGNTVQSSSLLGRLVFNGYDGSNYQTGGSILCEVDGTPGANDTPGRIILSTTADGASSPTERLRITSTGQVRLAGAGITFNGDTATANELDDYEEGTFTPDLAFSTSNGDLTYTRQSGFYTKIGRQVTIAVHIAFSETTASGNVTLTGLPFTSLNTSFNRASFSVFGSSLTGVTDGLAAALLQNSTTLELYAQNAGNVAALTSTSTGASNLLTITGSYFV